MSKGLADAHLPDHLESRDKQFQDSPSADTVRYGNTA